MRTRGQKLIELAKKQCPTEQPNKRRIKRPIKPPIESPVTTTAPSVSQPIEHEPPIKPPIELLVTTTAQSVSRPIELEPLIKPPIELPVTTTAQSVSHPIELEPLIKPPIELPVTTAPSVTHPVELDNELDSALRTFEWIQQHHQFLEQCTQSDENNQSESAIIHENELQLYENELSDALPLFIRDEQSQVGINDLSEVDKVLLLQIDDVPVEMGNDTQSQVDETNTVFQAAKNVPQQDYFPCSSEAENNNNVVIVEEVAAESVMPTPNLANENDNSSESENEDPKDPSYVAESHSGDTESEDENLGNTSYVRETHLEEQSKNEDENASVHNELDTEEDVPIPRKRARKGHSDPPSWIRNKNQKLREHGLPYLGVKRKAGMSEQQHYSIPRTGRTIGNRCECKLSKLPNSSLQCGKITDEQRQICFRKFWEMNWSEKKGTVRSLVNKRTPRASKNRKNSEVSRRTETLEFHLKNFDSSTGSENIIRVCKPMFLRTLGLKEWTVSNWVRCPTNGSKLPKVNSRRVATEKQKEVARQFFHSLPKMESHYCRADTTRLYLEPVWESKQDIHRAYTEYCDGRKKKPLHIKALVDIMDEMKISLYRPRKDLCDLCLGYDNKNPDITKEMYDLHIQTKNEARSAMEADIENEDYKYVFTMDLQAVLVCPVTKASAGYYKSKLIVHNFTIYDCRTHQGFCYLWDETEADLQASVFATLIIKFLENLSLDEGDVVVLWSDGCCYQNRNEILANALLNFSMNRKIIIFQKYLEKGHTQMRCDAMHSKIERKYRKQEIYLPSTYITFCEKARRTPAPFNVMYCHHEYFLDFSKIKFYSSIRPGQKKGDPVVVDLRALKYTPEGTISYKLAHSQTSWTELKRTRRSTVNAVLSPPKLFSERLKITAKKWTQIQELKHVLPRDTHAF